MAANKDAEVDDNPFSFKRFVTDRDKPAGHKSKKKNTAAKTVENKGTDKQTDDLFPDVIKKGATISDNPYSFKAYLKKKKKKPSSVVPTVPPSATDKTTRLLLQSSDTDSSFDSDDDNTENKQSLNNELPLIHDPPLPSIRPIKSSPGQERLPKLSIHDAISINSNSDSSDDELLLQAKEHILSKDLNINDDIDDDDLMEPFPGVVSIATSGGDETRLAMELKKQKEETILLTKRLKECEDDLKNEKKKNKSLSKDIKSLKIKEQSETKALEAMILKVEENLTTANKRSVVAESTIVKLKKEIQKLQAELAASKSPQDIYHSYEELIVGVREKANYASQQLATVSQRADLQIKELCQGIETLKVVSDILYNIDSSFEVKNN